MQSQIHSDKGTARTAERAQPLLGQRAPEIQPYGTLAQYPIALDERVRAASIEALNQILADTMMLRDLYAMLPFVDVTFDTTLISLALHHCADPEGVLDEGIRVTRFRLIILESVYRNQWERFCLERFDSWLNRYRYGGNMQTPLAYKRPEEWQQMFDARALQTIDRRWLGPRRERLLHQPLLWVLEKVASRGAAGTGCDGEAAIGGRAFDHARRGHA